MSEQKVTPQLLTDAQKIHLGWTWEVLDELASRRVPTVFTEQDQNEVRLALTDLLFLMGHEQEEEKKLQIERGDDAIIDDEFEGDPSWRWTLPEEFRY